MRFRGSNNQSFRQPQGMMGLGNTNPMVIQQQQQQQQMMMIQQQQFMARQQIIQQEQLQKQRQLRQEEEKQAGIMAAIRDLQQKTLSQQQQQQHPQLLPPNLPAQRPQFQQHPPLQPRGLVPSVNKDQDPSVLPYRFNPGIHGDTVRSKHHTNQTPPSTDFGGSNSYTTHSAPSSLSNIGFSQPNNFSSVRLNTFPPVHGNSPQPPLLNMPPGLRFPGTQPRPQFHTPGRDVGSSPAGLISSVPMATKSPVCINQPPGFDKAVRNINSSSSSNVLVSQTSRFGNFTDNTHKSSHVALHGSASDSVIINSSRPPLLDIPGKSAATGFSDNTTDRNCPPHSSPHMSQQNVQNNSWSVSGRVQDDYKERISNDSVSKAPSRELERRDRVSSDFSRSQHRNDRSERGSADYRSKQDRNGSRDRVSVSDRGSPHRSHSSRSRDRPIERSRSNTSLRDESRHSTERSHSRSHDRASYRENGRQGSSFSTDFSSSDLEARRRDRPRRASRERSHSSSRNSISSSKPNIYSKNRMSNRRQSSPQASRDSSSSRRPSPQASRDSSNSRRPSPQPSRDSSRREITKRSRSPSSSERSYSGQLSQYRQDLLNSEQKNRDQNNLSPKRQKLDMDLDDDYSDVNKEEELQLETDNIIYFTRSCPADLYFSKNPDTGDMVATNRMIDLEKRFEEEIVKRAEKVRATQAVVDEPAVVQPAHHHHHHCTGHKSSSSCDSSSDEEDNDDDDDDENSCSQIMEEWDKRKKHPYSLHPELWFNLKGQANDGPLCRCSIKSRQSGIRHEIYPGEKPISPCEDESSNLSRLHHYRITMSPYTNFLTKVPTLINHDNHEYIFEGFSMFSHVKLENIPPCKLLRFNIEYTISFVPESAPENFTVRSLNLFNRFIFSEILELIDVDWTGPSEGCQRFHFLPRFCRTLPDSGCKEVLSMNTVLSFLLKSVKPLVDESRLEEIMNCGESEWHAKVDNLRGMIVTNPGMRPSSIRVDQLDRKVTTPVIRTENFDDSGDEKRKTAKRTKEDADDGSGETEKEVTESQPKYPLIIHQGYRPAQLSYAGDPVYRKAWKQYVKFRHLLNSKPKILAADKLKLKEQEEKLREIRMKKTMKREVTVELSSKGFLCTGLRADLCQHSLMVPVLMSHLRFHICLDMLEGTLDYKFKDRNQLQLSLTHTSYRTNYGTNPDHTRNSLTNCGMRQVEYGNRRIHYQNTRKRGICILVDIMSRFGKQEETISEIPHNERLEFLGDAVIEFLTSVHLFYMFPWLEEGGLTTYRMALVQNQHLAVLAKKLKLQDFMLYVHGPDLCHESDLRHAMANCCEAIMGALYLDGGLEVADRIFSKTLFDDESILLQTWNDLPRHVLQQEEPGGDRHWVKSSPILQKMEKFEERIGIKFNHIRILAKAFTHRNIGVNPLTLGHNQRLEFLGDTVLQLVASEYLYRHYPEHHEGHLSLLRSSLVNSRTQGLVYDDLGMSDFLICNENAVSDGLDMKTKQRADILESFVGALFVDKDLDYCRSFCNVCFFPRLKDFIMNQDWNDPKSQLQQCCLTLREVGGGEPDIPIYKVIKSIGPTNTRKYVVAVYFRGKRLARGTGHSIQQAEMAAATQALKKRAELFPILQHQRRFLEKMRREDSEKDSDREDVPASRMLKRSRPNHRRRLAARSRNKFD